jgi:hypothetical protein
MSDNNYLKKMYRGSLPIIIFTKTVKVFKRYLFEFYLLVFIKLSYNLR